MTCTNVVGDTGIEPVISSVSGTGNAFAEVRRRAPVQVSAARDRPRMHANVAGRVPVGVRVGVRDAGELEVCAAAAGGLGLRRAGCVARRGVAGLGANRCPKCAHLATVTGPRKQPAAAGGGGCRRGRGTGCRRRRLAAHPGLPSEGLRPTLFWGCTPAYLFGVRDGTGLRGGRGVRGSCPARRRPQPRSASVVRQGGGARCRR